MVRKKDTEALLIAAFERLKAGKPEHPDLKAKARQGRRLVNYSNVALEAGISRRLIAYDDCLYPKVRALIRDYLDSAPRATISQALVDDLRAENRELRRQLELSDTYNAELRLELERLSKSRDGNHPEDETVVNFRRDRRRRDDRPPGPRH